tara:strand:+ start:251 stop:535 length:285 start_codon:yes stop_codon:yes gene_type:complete
MKAFAETYSIIKIEDLPLIDFTQVFQTSAETIRKSLDESLFVIKYNVEPLFIASGEVIPEQILTHSECVELMSTSAWSEPIPELAEDVIITKKI